MQNISSVKAYFHTLIISIFLLRVCWLYGDKEFNVFRVALPPKHIFLGFVPVGDTYWITDDLEDGRLRAH